MLGTRKILQYIVKACQVIMQLDITYLIYSKFSIYDFTDTCLVSIQLFMPN